MHLFMKLNLIIRKLNFAFNPLNWPKMAHLEGLEVVQECLYSMILAEPLLPAYSHSQLSHFQLSQCVDSHFDTFRTPTDVFT